MSVAFTKAWAAEYRQAQDAKRAEREAKKPPRKPPGPRSYYYGWDAMAIGDSHFKFHGNYSRMVDAWNAYRKNHNELDGWEIQFFETPAGVTYYRVK